MLLERLVCSAEYVGRVSAPYTPPGAGGVSLMLTHDSPQGLSRAAAQSAVQAAPVTETSNGVRVVSATMKAPAKYPSVSV